MYTGSTMERSSGVATGDAGSAAVTRAAGGGTRGRGALPFRRQRMRQPQPVEHPGQRVDDQVVDLLRPVVERGHRRQNHRAHLGQGGEHTEVAQVERGLAHDQDQRPALLEGHVGRARDQRVGAQWATAAAVLMLHGTITMPSVLNEPDATAAPMSRLR